jgi:hypothetical protein
MDLQRLCRFLLLFPDQRIGLVGFLEVNIGPKGRIAPEIFDQYQSFSSFKRKKNKCMIKEINGELRIYTEHSDKIILDRYQIRN